MTGIRGRRNTCGVNSLPYSLTLLAFLLVVVLITKTSDLITSYQRFHYPVSEEVGSGMIEVYENNQTSFAPSASFFVFTCLANAG
jgi:hypothetical protein